MMENSLAENDALLVNLTAVSSGSVVGDREQCGETVIYSRWHDLCGHIGFIIPVKIANFQTPIMFSVYFGLSQ